MTPQARPAWASSTAERVFVILLAFVAGCFGWANLFDGDYETAWKFGLLTLLLKLAHLGERLLQAAEEAA